MTLKVLDNGLLSPMIAEIKDLIGWDETIKLVQAYGGVYVDVPKVNSDGNCLNRVLSYSAAAKLIEHYGGTRLQIGKLHVALRNARDREILQRYQAGGVSARELALQYKLSYRTVRYIIERQEQADPASRSSTSQMSLDV